MLFSNSKFRTILRRSSDRPNYQELLSSLGARLSEPSNFELLDAIGVGLDFEVFKRQGQLNLEEKARTKPQIAAMMLQG